MTSGGVKAGLTFQLLQETHTHTTNQSDRAGHTGLTEGDPVLVVTTEHGLHLWVLYCG